MNRSGWMTSMEDLLSRRAFLKGLAGFAFEAIKPGTGWGGRPRRKQMPASLGKIAAAVSADTLRRHLTALVGVRHPIFAPERLEQAAGYIAEVLRDTGLEVGNDPFRAFGRIFRNVVGVRKGALYPEEEVLLTAHYDTVEDSPGADDNASGVAGLLEAARVLAPYRFRRTLQFVAFTLEEEEYLGSRHFVRRALNENRRIVAVFNLEMISYTSPQQQTLGDIPAPEVGDFIGVVGNTPSEALVATILAAANQFVPGLPVQTLILPGDGEGLPEVKRSDHAAFWEAGYPAVMITDTAFLRNPHYHQPTDTLATLDLPFLRRTAAAAAVSAAFFSGILDGELEG